MKKILSIDLDIIMSPCIQLYNNYATDNWDRLCGHFEILKFAKPDLVHYRKLIDMIVKFTKTLQKENIHFIKSHEMIVHHIDELNDTICLINIDHHHDIAYDKKDVENKVETLNCGNWVKYLFERDKIESYTWIRNEDSTDYEDESFKFVPLQMMEINLDSLDAPDELFICLSPQWIPPHLRTLYYIIVDIFNDIYETEFKVEGD